MKLHVFNPYDYALENIIQAGHMDINISHVPIDINPKTRISRLFKSEYHYVAQSIPILLRSYVIYKPLRTFFYAAVLPGLVGLFLCFRFLYYYLNGEKGFVQSLILAAVCLILSALLAALGILADLISANRRLSQEILFRTKVNKHKANKGS